MKASASVKSREEIAAAYDSQPWWYDLRGFFILTFAYNSTLTHQLRFFAPNFGARHLELACGTGTLLEMVLRWRKWKKQPDVSIVGVDYAEPMLAGAERRFAGRIAECAVDGARTRSTIGPARWTWCAMVDASSCAASTPTMATWRSIHTHN